MKHFTLWKSFLLLCALVVGSNAWGADEVYKTALFGSTNNSGNIGSYTTTWYSTTNGFKVNIANFNNNNNGWNGQIKCGRNGNASVASIYTDAAIDQAITKVVVKIEAINASKTNSIKLYTSTNGSSWTEVGTYTKATGEQEVVLSSPTANLYYKVEFDCQSHTSNGFNSISKVEYYKAKAPTFTLSAASNNESYGTVSVDDNVITASPKTGYRYATPAYTITEGEANVTSVVQNGDEFTVTATGDCAVQINFEAIPTYTVTFDAEGGSCATASLTESIGEGGVVLPTATISVAGWEFIGWAESEVTNTSTMPTLYKSGSTYYPTEATTLHAVYTLSTTGSTYTRVTSLDQIAYAKKIAVASSRSTSKILTHDASGVNAPTETTGEISVETNQMFALSGDNTTGYVLTGASGTLSQETLSASGSGNNDKAIDWSGTNNKWIIEVNTNADNLFALRNANSTQVALEYDSGWKTYYVGTYTSSVYTAMKLYIPKTAYNSNPSAITVPTVAFEKGGTTLYLDGTTIYTNTASVTGVSKTVNYSSSNTTVATVSDEGVVTAVGIGTATITASVDAELGVSASASDTYDVTVKSATTLAGIKACATSSTAVDFTADLASDVVITYVNGSHAYLQSGDVAVYASCADENWEAGKKFAGAISGKVKLTNSQYQITEIGQTPVAGGVVPDAIDVNIADLTTDNYATYEGRKVTISGAKVSTAMAGNATSGGKITDGTNTQNIYAPLTGISLVLNEKGNFTGYIGRYNTGIRLNMYEQSWFAKTHNAPQDQPMSFATASYDLSEDTPAYTAFVGQTVTGNVGDVTYNIEDGDDANNIISSIDDETGAIVLSGAYGTATITATAAAKDVTEAGVTTPYNETVKTYTVTVGARYTVKFHVNGLTTVLRESAHDAGIAVPDVADYGDYVFRGWNTAAVDPTDTKPAGLTTLNATIYPENNTTEYYAVFAVATGTPVVEHTSTFTLKQASAPSSPYVEDGASWTWSNVTFVNGDAACINSSNGSVTFTMPDGGTAKSLTITKTSNTWAGTAQVVLKDASSNTLNTFSLGSNASATYNFTSSYNQSAAYTLTNSTSKNAWINTIEFKYETGGISYSDYRTSLPTVAVSIGASEYASFCYDRALDFSTTGVNAYIAKVEAGKVKLTKVEDGIVPANKGVVLYGAEGSYEIPVAASAGSFDFTSNQMVGVTVRTQVFWNPSAGVYNYILQSGTFNKANDGFLKPNRAYLSTDYDVATLGGSKLTIIFDDDETTSINNIEEQGARCKVQEGTYNLAGQKVSESYKGIVIVNGKKVVRK